MARALHPIGAIVGVVAGIFSGVYVGMAMAIADAANRWLNHRLICLGGDVCAIGTVRNTPDDGGPGNFDDDEYFERVPMSFPTRTQLDCTKRGDWSGGNVGSLPAEKEQAVLAAHPANDLLLGNPQGIALMRPIAGITNTLPYSPTDELDVHCEAEGDVWERLSELGPAIAALAGALAVGTAAAVGGWLAGLAICAAFGPFSWVCLLVALLEEPHGVGPPLD